MSSGKKNWFICDKCRILAVFNIRSHIVLTMPWSDDDVVQIGRTVYGESWASLLHFSKNFIFFKFKAKLVRTPDLCSYQRLRQCLRVVAK